VLKNVIIFLKEPKSKIGWVHGILACIGALFLAYLSAMIMSKIIVGDYAIKIIPSMILTPIFISMYSIWLLFSRNTWQCLKKFGILSISLLLIFAVLMKVL